MEEQVKKYKEDLVSNFFSTTSKFNKNQGSNSDEPKTMSSPQYSSTPNDHHLSPPSNFQDRKGFNTTPSQNGYTHPFLVQSLPTSVAFLNQPKQIQYGNGIVQFYRPNQPSVYQKALSENGSLSQPGSPPERRDNLRTGSDYAGSEVDSSCFLSISPPPKDQEFVPIHHDQETDSQAGSVSPRPMDARSYASTFSFRSNNSSIRSKAEQKSYGAIQSTHQQERADRMSEQAESTEYEKAESETYSAKTEQFSRVPEKERYESNETSPRSEESPRSTGSPNSESFESTTPNATSPTPQDDLAAEEERAERRKPWKKRKRVQESEHEDSSVEKKSKCEDSNESPDCQDQQDATCDPN